MIELATTTEKSFANKKRNINRQIERIQKGIQIIVRNNRKVRKGNPTYNQSHRTQLLNGRRTSSF